MKIYREFKQLSPEWWALRRGVPTASEFSKIMTPKTCKMSAEAKTYAYRLLADRHDPLYPRLNNFTANAAMQQGTEMEKEARAGYELLINLSVDEVCFCTTDDGLLGCSPDALVGEDGLLEIKCPQPNTQIGYLMDATLPDEYRCQVHGHLVVTGRKWCDFYSYSAELPYLHVRVYPDDFTEKLRTTLKDFLALYQELATKLDAVRADPTSRSFLSGANLPKIASA